MGKTNAAALKALKSSHLTLNAERAVELLINYGVIDADPAPEPERYAQLAKDYLGDVGPKAVFDFVSGWSTSSWEHVIKEKLEHDTKRLQNVFHAIILLGKEAGAL